MNVEALETLQDALIKALDAVNAALASDEAPAKLGAQSFPIPSRIIRLSEVKLITGMSRSFIYNGIKNGTFPASVSLGARAVGWDRHEIDQWIQAKLKK